MFFSIVIANYNYGQYLESSIRSVLAQSCQDFELIIVDGGSTDDSVDIIKRYTDKVAWWCSEKDSGQSDAFNKGFRHASGKFLTWLNADDLMLPNTLKMVKAKLEATPKADWATGNFIRFNQHTGKIIEATWGPHWVPFCVQGNGLPLCVYGPTTFWSRKSYEEIGPINEHYHYTMDVDYWRRLIVAGYKFVRVNHACWAFRMHEESKTAEFGDHSRSADRKSAMDQENCESCEMSGYHVTRVRWLAKQVLRLLDGSFVLALLRAWLVSGRDVYDYYKIELPEGG